VRKIYINLGCGDGKVVRSFLEENPRYEAFGFDPIPHFDDEMRLLSKDYDFEYKRRAAWASNEKKTLYMHGKGGVCSSLLKEKVSSRFIKPEGWEKRIKEYGVDCFRFCQWFENNFSKRDYIVLYMDIELSENYILDDMIYTGLIKYVNELTVEFHKESRRNKYSDSFRGETERFYHKIVDYLSREFDHRDRLSIADSGGMWKWTRRQS